MNRYMLLEKRRVVSAREIVDQSRKKTARRLCGNQPVSDNDSSGHAGLSPLLEFNNVAFWIARINNAKRTDTSYFCRRNVAHCAAACRNHRLQRLIDVVDCKCDVREPALVRCRQAVLDHLIITENFKCRTVITVAGQA